MEIYSPKRSDIKCCNTFKGEENEVEVKVKKSKKKESRKKEKSKKEQLWHEAISKRISEIVDKSVKYFYQDSIE